MIDFRTRFRTWARFEALSSASPGRVAPEVAVRRALPGAVAPPRQLDEQVARWVEELESHGVSHAVAAADSLDDLAGLTEAAERTDDRLLPFVAVDPTAENELDELAAWAESGRLEGVVLAPSAHGYRLVDAEAEELFALAGEHDLLCVVECGVPDRTLERAFGIAPPFDPALASPLELLVPAELHPDLRFVVPSFGGGAFRELLLLAGEAPNVYTDTSATHRWRRSAADTVRLSEVFERAIDVLGCDRLLFGTASGAPWPTWRHEELVHQREAVGACAVSPEDRDRIFDGNARDLLGLPTPQELAQKTQSSTQAR